jgi:hypothetical protein
MKTISEITVQLIQQSPFLEEALQEGLINVSSLARKLQKDIESESMKKVNIGAITMAINRYSPAKIIKLNQTVLNCIQKMGDFTIRYGICCLTVDFSPTFHAKHREIVKKLEYDKDLFFTYSQGVSEACYIISEKYVNTLKDYYLEENITVLKKEQAIINLKLPEDSINVPGAYYYILKELAWYNINITEIVSTSNELTVVVDKEYVENVFLVLNKMKFKNI